MNTGGLVGENLKNYIAYIREAFRANIILTKPKDEMRSFFEIFTEPPDNNSRMMKRKHCTMNAYVLYIMYKQNNSKK